MLNTFRMLASAMFVLSVFQVSFGQAAKAPRPSEQQATEQQATEQQAAEKPAAEKLGAEIASKIAKEDQITIDLFKKIQSSEEALKSVVLVDVRSDAETKVSIIPGAITKAQFEAEPEKYKGKTAICYCLSGGRSGKYVKLLKAKDRPAVDLKGSITGWIEAGLPLTTLDGKPTKRVNVYGNKVPAGYESVE